MKIKKLVVLLSVIAVTTGSTFVQAFAAAEENTCIKKETYISQDKDEERLLFPDELNENGKEYHLENIVYEVIKEIPVTKEVKFEKQIQSDPIKTGSNDQNLFAEKFIENDVTFFLVDTVSEIIKTKDASSQEVTDAVSYDYKVTESNVPATREVAVTDTLTGEIVKVVCPLKNIVQGESQWTNAEISIVYENYDSSEFEFYGSTIYKTGSPLEGYEELLLQSVGLNKSNAKIISLNWNGDPYEVSGTIYRNGTAAIQKLTTTYIANYEGSIEHPEETATVYTLYYEGVDEVETGEMNYEIEATATYVPSMSVAAKILTGVAILILLIFVVVLIYVIGKKKGKKLPQK